MKLNLLIILSPRGPQRFDKSLTNKLLTILSGVSSISLGIYSSSDSPYILSKSVSESDCLSLLFYLLAYILSNSFTNVIFDLYGILYNYLIYYDVMQIIYH